MTDAAKQLPVIDKARHAIAMMATTVSIRVVVHGGLSTLGGSGAGIAVTRVMGLLEPDRERRRPPSPGCPTCLAPVG